jgi:hypothetical protein
MFLTITPTWSILLPAMKTSPYYYFEIISQET